MVQLKLKTGSFALCFFFSSFLYAFDHAHDFSAEGGREAPAFSLRQTLIATGSSSIPATKVVTWIGVAEIEKTNLKALRFQFKTGSSAVSEAYFLIVNEKNIERGKNEKGEAEAGAKARIVLSLAFLMPIKDRVVGGAQYIDFARAVNLYTPGLKKMLTVEIRNDTAQKINQWNDPDNYFVKDEGQGDIPAFKVSNISVFKKSEENKTNMNSRDLREQFLNEQ